MWQHMLLNVPVIYIESDFNIEKNGKQFIISSK